MVWLVAGLWLIPPLLESIYRGESLAFVGDLIPAFKEQPLDFYLQEWQGVMIAGTCAFFALAGFSYLLLDRPRAERLVGVATPGSIGAIRMLVCGILMLSVLWESLPSSAALPREMIRPMGVLQLLYLIPGFDWFTANATALAVFEVFTFAVLTAGFVGWRTRLVLPIGAACYIVFAGLLRHYAWFYHTGLVPAYLLVVLSMLPAGDGWSIDRLRRIWNGKPVPSADEATTRYGWARYTLWAVLALPYVAAGFSKLRNGGLFWWDAVNFKYILFYSTLRPMEFDFSISLLLAHAPDYVFEIMAVVALAGEMFYGLVLFFRWARWVMPTTMALMHIGILFLQNILFFDLLVLQVIFFDFRRARESLGRRTARIRGTIELIFDAGMPAHARAVQIIRSLDLFNRIEARSESGATLSADWNDERFHGERLVRLLAAACPAGWIALPFLYLSPVSTWAFRRLTEDGGEIPRPAPVPVDTDRGRPRLVLVLTAVLLFFWVFRVEFYPFTGMQMFSHVRGPVVTYEIPKAYLASGNVIPAPIEKSIRAMRDSRYRRILQRAFDDESGSRAASFMQAVAHRWNASAPDDERIERIEIERWEWNYETDPDNPNHGDLIDRRSFEVDSIAD